MQGGVVELAKQAAAAARAERGERGWATLPVRRYRGVERRGDMFVAEIMDAGGLRPVCLGLYETPVEAAYAYDAAARMMHGDRAMPNFPEPRAPAPAGGGRGAAPRARAGQLPLMGHARVRVPLNGQQLAPPQAPAVAPVGGGAQRQAFSAQQAPMPHFGAPYRPGAAPAFSQFLAAGVGAGPAFAAAGGSGSNLAAAFYGLAAMIGGPEPEKPMLNYAANSAFSSNDKEYYKALVDASAAADQNQNLIIVLDDDSDSDDYGDREPAVEDNFHYFTEDDGGASTSSAAPPAPVPPLRLKDLMEAEIVRRSADEGAP